MNTVWKGDVCSEVALGSLNISCGLGVIEVKHQKTQPEQYIVKFDNKSTMLIFKSGKFRVMGNGDAESVIVNILGVISQFSEVIPLVTLQTMTGVFKYNRKIHLQKLTTMTECLLDLENFPAVQIRKFKPIHVNVFSTGCVTICGLKTREHANVIKDFLDTIIPNCFIEIL